jgi:hypothetical protein
MKRKPYLSRATLVTPLILAVAAFVKAADDQSPATPPASPTDQASPPKPGKALPQAVPTAGARMLLAPYPSWELPSPSAQGVASPQLNGLPILPEPSTPPGVAPEVAGAVPGVGVDSSVPPGGSSTAGSTPGQTPPSSAFPGAETPGPAAGAAADLFGGSGGAATSGLGGVRGGAPSAFAMIGDSAPPIGMLRASASGPPVPPPPNSRSIVAPSVRGFKIAENQSPIPQDRFFFSFNYFNDVNKTLDNHFTTAIKGIEIYRYVFGYEKTFNDGMGSIGIRVPIDNIFAKSRSAGLNSGGDSTSAGNLTVYFKHIFAYDKETGSVASGGVAISPQTAPSRFGGASFLGPNNSTTIQPYFAFLINRDRFYLQGFTAIDVPTDPAQATLLYNDIGMGYYVYRDNESNNLITAVAPTVEVHVNTPINHIGGYNPFDANSTPDIVNITSGVNTRFRQNSILTLGVVTPVTGPKPFNVEGTVLLNVYFGRSRRNPAAPIIGG